MSGVLRSVSARILLTSHAARLHGNPPHPQAESIPECPEYTQSERKLDSCENVLSAICRRIGDILSREGKNIENRIDLCRATLRDGLFFAPRLLTSALFFLRFFFALLFFAFGNENILLSFSM